MIIIFIVAIFNKYNNKQENIKVLIDICFKLLQNFHQMKHTNKP
jgi:hypothetical protein